MRNRGRGREGIEILEKAVKKEPGNPRLRTELAAQIAASGAGEIEWGQIEDLLQNGSNVTAENRYFYALLLASRGDLDQRKEAIQILRKIGRGATEYRLDAQRLQAMTMMDVALSTEGVAEEEKRKLLAESRSIFTDLLDREPVALIDMTRFCNFLIQVNEEGDQEILQVCRMLHSTSYEWKLPLRLRRAMATKFRES